MQLSLSGEVLDGSDGAQRMADPAVEATVRIDINEDGDMPEFTCSECDEVGTQYPDDVRPNSGPGNERCRVECGSCAGDGTDDDGKDCEACDGTGQDGHDWRRTPLSWCNSARIVADPDEDEVTLLISTGDPRGAFAITVWRTETGRLLMRLPRPDDAMPHEDLTPYGPPANHVFQIGHYGPAGVAQ
jgi:hypothetical protein